MDSTSQHSMAKETTVDGPGQGASLGPAVGTFVYDAFFSYASDPDRHLVRAVERFVEGLHDNPLVEPRHRRELEACVDGSDFRKPRRLAPVAEGQEQSDPVFSLITQYMARSRCLVVFVGPQSNRHRWLTAELQWWLAHRAVEDVHLVLSHGTDATPVDWMPQAAIDAGLDKVLWFDFRNAPVGSARGSSNRIFEEERLRLAATLIGEDVAAADLIKTWRELSATARLRRRLEKAFIAFVVSLLAIGLGWAVRESWVRTQEAKVGLWTTLANAGGSQDPDRRLDALSYGASALHALPRAEAFRATAESLQILAQPAESVVIDSSGHAVDTVAYLARDAFLVTGGYDKTARLVRRSDLQVQGSVELQGRAVSIVDIPERALLVVTTRTGVDVLRYALEPVPALVLVGRAQVQPVRVEGTILRGNTLAAAIDQPSGTLFVSATSGRVEWYRLAEAAVGIWRPFHSVTLTDSQGLPLGPFGMAYAPATNRLVVADASGEIACLDAKTGAQATKNFKHSSDIFAMSSHAASGQVVAADARGGWLMVDPATCLPKRTLEPPTPFGSIAPTPAGIRKGGPQVDAARTSALFSPDGSLMSITGHDGTARVVAASSAAYVAIAPHTVSTRSSAISKDNRELVVATADGRLTFWRIDGGAERTRLADIEDVALNPAGTRALLIGHGQLAEIDLESGKVLSTLQHEDLKGVVRVGATPIEDRYLVWRRDSGYWFRVLIQAGSGGRMISLERMDAGVDQRARVTSVQALGDGGLLLATHGENRRVDLRGPTGKVLFHRPVAADPVPPAVVGGLVVIADQSGAVSAVRDDGREVGRWVFGAGGMFLAGDGRTFVMSGSVSGKPVVHLCDVRDGATGDGGSTSTVHCQTLDVAESIQHGRVSPTGDAVALAVRGRDTRTDSGSVLLARRSEGWKVRRLTESGRVDSIQFSRDGTSLALGERRGLSLWRVADLASVVALPTPSPVRKLAMTKGAGDELLILSIDGLEPEILRIWETSAAAFIRRACARWPKGRATASQPGVAELPPRDVVCKGL